MLQILKFQGHSVKRNQKTARTKKPLSAINLPNGGLKGKEALSQRWKESDIKNYGEVEFPWQKTTKRLVGMKSTKYRMRRSERP
jgi:hypothetical protein